MKYIFILLSQLFTFSIQAQIINIPDPNFKNILVNSVYDTNNDDEIDISEALNIYALDVTNSNITSLEGIQYFTNLDTLICDNNNISDLSVLNTFSYFSYLSCSNNNLTSLDLSNFSSIMYLICSNNQLTSLDISSLQDALI